MTNIKPALISIACIFILVGLSTSAVSKMSIYAQDIDARFEYDNNVTRQKLPENYQDGIIWRLYTGVGVRNFIPLKSISSESNYTLGMRDVNTTNNEDYNSHEIDFKLKIRDRLSIKETYRIWNSQSDLFHFHDNIIDVSLEHSFKDKTRLYALYKNEQKIFQNKKPEVQARNFFYHQFGLNVYHSMSSDFIVHFGYVNQSKTYNRKPIDFKYGKPVIIDGIQRDRQNILIMGFHASVFNNTNLMLSNQIIKSKSNSSAFDFNGNRTQIVILSNPINKLWAEFVYQLVAYNLAVYQTPDLGYELGENRTDDQSGIKIGLTYDISKQLSFKVNYEHLKNTVFFTKDSYESNIISAGLKIKF